MTFFDDIIDGISAAWDNIQESFSETSVGSPVQSCPLKDSQKSVSEKTMKRLEAAQEAIDYAKGKFPYGAGNQKEALKASDFNTYFRMKAARDNSAFEIPPEVEEIAKKNPEAFKAAKAELAKSGNCGEHAYVVYDYLRQKFPDERIQLAQQEGLDHAFVIIGDPSTEEDGELVVADAWPTDPTPVLWEDHFAYTSDKKKLLNHASSKGDNRDYKQEMFDAGLSLNDKGDVQVEKSYTKKETEKAIKDGSGSWIWEHSDTATTSYDYTVSSCPVAPSSTTE